MAVEFHADINVFEIFIDVGDISVGSHEIGETCPGSFQGGLYVLQRLAQLRTHISYADNLASFISGKLARHEDQLSWLNTDDV